MVSELAVSAVDHGFEP